MSARSWGDAIPTVGLYSGSDRNEASLKMNALQITSCRLAFLNRSLMGSIVCTACTFQWLFQFTAAAIGLVAAWHMRHVRIHRRIFALLIGLSVLVVTCGPSFGVDAFEATNIIDQTLSQSGAASAATQPGAPTTCTSLSVDCVVSQSSGYDTGIYPHGVPTHFSWYKGGSAAKGSSAPPSDFSSLTGWGQIYPQVGASNVAANIYLKDYRVYAHLTGVGWQLVQYQAANSVGGGHYLADFANNSSSAMILAVQSDGSVRMDSPVSGYNNHFWIEPRGSFTPGTIDGVFSMAQLRTDNAGANLIANFGGDWWRNTSAPFLYRNGVFVNNPGIGMGAWVKLTTTYQYFFFTTMTKPQLQADPPPPLR